MRDAVPRQHDDENVREEAVNVLLGEALRRHGISARAERRAGSSAPDLRIDLPAGETALVECKWAGARSDLDRQLQRRVAEFPEALGRIGVLYPERLRTVDDLGAALEQAGDLRWYVHSSRRDLRDRPTNRSGNVAELSDQLRLLPLELEGADRVVEAVRSVSFALDRSVRPLSQHQRTMHRVSAVIARTDNETDQAAALRIGCLVLFNALAFQERLADVNQAVPTIGEIMSGRGGGGVKPAISAKRGRQSAMILTMCRSSRSPLRSLM